MSTFKETFHNPHTFLAVVHVENISQALRNAKIAEQGGADGIFLINHSSSYQSLLESYWAILEQLPEYWVGLNCLDLGRSAVDVIPKQTSGLWVDDAGIDEGYAPTEIAKNFANRRQRSGWKGLYFGGVAFKYQKEIYNTGKVAKLATSFVDVITTSGISTGKAADLQKICTMREAIGDHPLAVASGITPENVCEYMPYVDCFLVATGVSDSHTELNPDRVQKLSKMIGK